MRLSTINRYSASAFVFLVASLLPAPASAQEPAQQDPQENSELRVDYTEEIIFESTKDGALLEFSTDGGLIEENKHTYILTDNLTGNHKKPDNIPDRVQGAYSAAGADVERRFGNFYRQMRDGLVRDYVWELMSIAVQARSGNIQMYTGVRNTRDVYDPYHRGILEKIAGNNKTPFGGVRPFNLVVAEKDDDKTQFAVASDDTSGTFWFFVNYGQDEDYETRINLYQPKDGTKAMVQGLGSTLQTLLARL